MQSYEDIIRKTAALDWRIHTHMPENYMKEIFGETRETAPNLYNRLWWAMRSGLIVSDFSGRPGPRAQQDDPKKSPPRIGPCGSRVYG